MKNIILLISAFVCLQANAAPATVDFASKANVTGICTIQATDISFGTLASPLTAQSSSANLKVLCNRDLPYTIAMAYGGSYGQGQVSGNTYQLSSFNYGGNGEIRSFLLETYNSSGVKIAGGPQLNLNIQPSQLASYMQTNYGCNYSAGTCTTAGSDYGVLNGVSKGNVVAYSISIPGEPNKIWNTGKNSYTAKGSGKEQLIPVNIKIVPDKSSSLYPAADFYMDTITTSIVY